MRQVTRVAAGVRVGWRRAHRRRLALAGAVILGIGVPTAAAIPVSASPVFSTSAAGHLTSASTAARAGLTQRATRAAATDASAPASPAQAARQTATAAPDAVPGPPSGWSTEFSDDFNGSAGSGPSSSWMYDTGPGSSFGTGEIETMTN
jgi:hypothetical protein